MNKNRYLVIKRDGVEVAFDEKLIEQAINAAAKEACETIDSPQVVGEVLERLPTDHVLTVANIQQTVEQVLMDSKYKAVAKTYIEYRSKRDEVRERQSDLRQEVDKFFGSQNLEVSTENANKDSRIIPTQRDLIAGMISKDYAMKYMLPKRVATAHKEGMLHYHDMDYSPLFGMYNCQLGGFEKMLQRGFKMGNAEIEQPRSIDTAAAVTAQLIAQISSHSYGGTSFNRIDEALAKYVTMSYEKHLKVGKEWETKDPVAFATARTEKECFDAMQALEYEVNTLHTSNGQTPFVTFGLGLGKSWEERLIQKCILQNRINGLGKKKKTAVFPKLCFALKDGLNLKPEDPNYDIKQLALECQRKRIYPDFLNYEQVVKITGSFKTPMGCRSFLGNYTNEQGEEVIDGRNNLGVVTISPLGAALKAGGDREKFWHEMEQLTDTAFEALMYRINRFKTVTAAAAPILYQKGSLGCDLESNESVYDTFKDGFSSISLGYLGLHETVTYLTGEKPFFSEESYQLQLDIMKFMKAKVDKWKKETGFAFSLYATPNESTSTRMVKIYKETHGEIPEILDHHYLTNSYHLDVRQPTSAFKKIDFEAPFVPYSSGGFVNTVDMPNLKQNPEAHETLVDYAYSRVPYFMINQPVDECYECHFKGEFNGNVGGYSCPKCGNSEEGAMSVTRRVSGYLSDPDARPFNIGKQTEVVNRVKHVG